MNFRAHFAGGVAAGTAAAAVSVLSGDTALSGDSARRFFSAGPDGGVHLAGVFAVAWFMALFPDLDTASVPQRWFLRAMFALLVAALAWGRLDLFVVLAFAALLPLLHRHRGWTHWKVTPWLIALFLATVHETLRARSAWFSGFSWDNVWLFLRDYWIYVAACVMGHYTHLLLDARQVKWLPFIRNAAGHH